jgi:hypothetical protein
MASDHAMLRVAEKSGKFGNLGTPNFFKMGVSCQALVTERTRVCKSTHAAIDDNIRRILCGE